MDVKRSYRQFCGLAKGLDLLGERWTLLVVRNLLLGPRRYSDLLDELPGITTNLLAKRLQSMETQGLVEKQQLPHPSGTTVYALTEAGAALEPVIMELARWGGQLLDPSNRKDLRNLGWGLLSLKRRYRGGTPCVAHLDVDGRVYELGLEGDYLRVTDRATRPADVTVKGSTQAVVRWLSGEDVELAVTGSRQAWKVLQHAFLPPAAAFARRKRYAAS